MVNDSVYISCPNVSASGHKTFADQVHFILNGPVMSVLVLQGLVTNSVALSVFCRRPRPCIYLYLIALAVWDQALLCSATLLFTVPAVVYGDSITVGHYVPTYRYWYYLCNATMVGSVWMVVTLTCDRYMALCHPLRHHALTRATIKKILLVVSFAVFCFSLPRIFEFSESYCVDAQGIRQPKLAASYLRFNVYYHYSYKVVCGMLFYSLVPYVLLFLLMMRISTKMRAASLHRSIMAQASMTHNKTHLARSRRKSQSPSTACLLKPSPARTSNSSGNVMLLAVTIKFLLSYLLAAALDVCESVLGGTVFMRAYFIGFMIEISNIMIILNSSSNFWLYIATSSVFRSSVRKQFVDIFKQSIDSKPTNLSEVTYGGRSSVVQREWSRHRSMYNPNRNGCVLSEPRKISAAPNICRDESSSHRLNIPRAKMRRESHSHNFPLNSPSIPSQLIGSFHSDDIML